MGTDEQQGKFLEAVQLACRVAKIFNEHGARKGGVIRIDSAEFGVEKWKANPGEGTARIIDTFKKLPLSLPIMGSVLQLRVKFVGRVCTVGKMFWTCWKELGCPKPWVFRLIWLILTSTSWDIMHLSMLFA